MSLRYEGKPTLGVHADRIYIDHGFSGTTRRNRNGLDQALAAVWPGSVFTVTKFDRFARNVEEACQILGDLSGRDVLFGMGASRPSGRIGTEISGRAHYLRCSGNQTHHRSDSAGYDGQHGML
ncbi:recombinase family protein [Streptosporangium amethystogenes subsp. fukuiense]|uniref:Recombinase family protein n=1 Tax=Streptosporangium amethystogenes subsp. fukuiense TaxID=698418 RepID=A0ABW2SVK4_9ACTN